MNEVIREPSMSDLWNVWFSELHKKRVGLTIKIKSMIYSKQTPFQRIDVLDTYEFGKMLVLYGSIMFTEKDEFIYHEMITHVGLFTHANPKKVLIIGGGDGGALREVLKHTCVESVKLVEIDKEVIEVTKQFFPNMAVGFNDKRTTIIFEDGAKYVKETKEKFDMIIVDSSDPIGPAESLFTTEFYSNLAKMLNKDGVLTLQTQSPFYHQQTVKKIYKNLMRLFKITKMYLAYIPTYPSGIWSFAFCSNTLDPLKYFAKQRYDKLKTTFKYYNQAIHHAAFSLPNFIEELLR